MRIILVEDDHSLSDALVRALTSEGNTVDSVNTGAAALFLAENTDADAVILDLGLPDMDGLEVLAGIRRIKSQLPVILLTARDSLQDKVSGLESGADDYLTKPFDVPELIARLRVIASQRSGQPSQLVKRLEKPYTMTRSLPKVIWQRYVATAENISDAATVTTQQLDAFIHRVPNQSCILNDDGSIRYQLTLSALRSDNYGAIPAFANALLGPSYNYEPPEYRSHDGTLIETALLEDVAELCEQHTEEIDWKDGDIAIIDNKRCLHGRRAITVPLSERSLFIAMGSRRAHSQ